jgi:hypothetical protein
VSQRICGSKSNGCRKEDLRRITKATGGTLISSQANIEGEEIYEAGYLDSAAEVIQERISDDELIFIKGTKVVDCAQRRERLHVGRDGESVARLALHHKTHPGESVVGRFKYILGEFCYNPGMVFIKVLARTHT